MIKTLALSTPVFKTPPRPGVQRNTQNFQFETELNAFDGSLLRFTDWEKDGFNHKQKLQYFFPERDEPTNEKNGDMYPSTYCYTYTPRKPLNIVNVQIFTSKNAIDDLPNSVHEYFTHNASKDSFVIRSKASDNHEIDNAFYNFIFEKVTAKISNVDGVYMSEHGAAHEEIVLQQSGLDKLEYERRARRPTVREHRHKKIRRVTVGKKLYF